MVSSENDAISMKQPQARVNIAHLGAQQILPSVSEKGDDNVIEPKTSTSLNKKSKKNLASRARKDSEGNKRKKSEEWTVN